MKNGEKMSFTTNQLRKWMLPIIFILFTIMAAIFYLTLGIRKGNDTAWYLRGAQDLLAGRALGEQQIMYAGFFFLVAFFEWIGIGLAGIVILQILLAGLAGFTMYKIGYALDGEQWTGFIAAALFLLNPDIMFWHFYQLTDSLYISLVIICTWFVYRAHKKEDLSSTLLAAVIVLITTTIRPNGWLIAPIAALYLLLSNSRITKKSKAAVLITSAILFIALLAMLPDIRNRLGEWFLNSQRFSEGVIIYGYKEWNISMPDNVGVEIEGLPSGLMYILRHPLASLGLIIGRVLAELAHIRPYFSLRHNLFVVISLYPLYMLAVIGMVKAPNKELSRLMLMIIAAHLAIIGLTWAIWEGRFLLYFLPLIYVYSAHTLKRIMGKLIIRHMRIR